MSAGLAAPPAALLVRYGELALKGKNRGVFERALVQNLRRAARPLSEVEIERSHGRIAVFPERRAMEVARRLARVFGVKSVSPAWSAEPRPEEIARVAGPVFERALGSAPAGEVTFRVRSRRADKSFPLTSMELDRYVAERLSPDRAVRVRLEGSDLELGIEVRPERAWLYCERLPGPGGLPVGTLGRVLCLLSGGIDSPVAAWMSMKRGCQVGFVTFHSYPYVGHGSRKKVVDLARQLAGWQGPSRLFVAPLTETQTQVRERCPESYRTVLYRRMMQRIAKRLAESHGYRALVTGDSLGQVASQTLENLVSIDASCEGLVLRPLIGFDKEETIARARRIGTFDISVVAEPDCCTVFQPERPVLRGTPEECAAAEAGLDVEGLVARAVGETEVLTVDPEA